MNTISVVIPIYNVEKYLKRCLDSVIKQTYSNLEIILVDDGSTDNSGKICDAYAQKDKRIMVIHKENSGLVSARKTGVIHATGEYVSYVDSDDWIDVDMYEKLMKQVSIYFPDIIAFGFQKEYSNHTEWYIEYLPEGIYYASQKEELLNDYINQSPYFYTPIIKQNIWAKLIKTRIIKEKQMQMDNRICVGEDCISYACLLAAKSLLVLKECPYHYCVRTDSMMHKRQDTEYKTYQLLVKYLNGLRKEYDVFKPLIIQTIYNFLLLIAPEKLLSIKENRLFLFPQINSASRIIIFGKGVLGKLFYELIEKNRLGTIVEWIDSSEIYKIKALDSELYDYIMIAVINGQIVRKIENNLVHEKIDIHKIIKIEKDNLLEENLPEEIREIVNNA